MYRDVKQWQDIRYQVLECGVSKRQVMRATGISWTILAKILTSPYSQDT